MRKIMHKNKTVIIWTQGGRRIGMGHLARCIVIARELRKKGICSLFLINDDSACISWIARQGFKYAIANASEDIYKIIANDPMPILIDTKKQFVRFIRRLKGLGASIILMDNIASARLEADIVILPSLVFNKRLSWDNFKGKVFKGAEYIPISDTYFRARKKAKHLRLKQPYQILITMGGSDPNHLTYRILLALLGSKLSLNIKIVMGPAFLYDHGLVKIEKKKYSNIEFIRKSKDLSKIMAMSHIAITAMGTTVYELAVVGIPTIIITNFKDDRKDIKFFKRLRINMPLGYYKNVADSEIISAVSDLISDQTKWDEIRSRAWKTIRKNGAKSIARIIKNMFMLENKNLDKENGS